MSISGRIKILRGGLTQKQFADKMGVSLSAVQLWEYKNKVPNGDVLSRFIKDFNVNINWLLTGDGKPFVGEPLQPERPAAEHHETRHDRPPPNPISFQLDEAIGMATRVLTSGTSYAEALYLNIQHFDRAIKSEETISRLEKRIDEIASQFEELKRENAEMKRMLTNPVKDSLVANGK